MERKRHGRNKFGQDPIAYIVSANLTRRNMTKGQQAMAFAMVYPEPEKGGRGKKSLIIKEFNQGRVSQARTVLRHSRKLSEAVIAGTISLNDALAKIVGAFAALKPPRYTRLPAKLLTQC